VLHELILLALVYIYSVLVLFFLITYAGYAKPIKLHLHKVIAYYDVGYKVVQFNGWFNVNLDEINHNTDRKKQPQVEFSRVQALLPKFLIVICVKIFKEDRNEVEIAALIHF